MATVGALMVDIGANVARLQTDLNKASSQVSSFTKKTEQSFKALATSITAYFGAAKMWSLMETAAEFEERKDYLNRLATAYGTTADAIVDNIKKVSQGMIGQRAAVEVAADAMFKRLGPEQVTKLAEASTYIANFTGGKVKDVFKELTESIAIGREKAIKSLVGIMDLSTRYSEKQISSMSALEKRTALYNMVVDYASKLQDKLGDSGLSTADKMERLKVQVEGLNLVIGQGLLRAAAGALGGIQWLAAGVMKLYEWINRFDEWTNRTLGESGLADIAKERAEAAKKASEDLIGDSLKNFELMTAGTQELGKALSPGMEQAAKKVNNEWDKLKRKLSFEAETATMDDYNKQLMVITNQAREYRAEWGNKKEIAYWETTMKSAAAMKHEIEEATKTAEAMNTAMEKQKSLSYALQDAAFERSLSESKIMGDLSKRLVMLSAERKQITTRQALKEEFRINSDLLDKEQERITMMTIRAETDEELVEVYKLQNSLNEKRNSLEADYTYNLLAKRHEMLLDEGGIYEGLIVAFEKMSQSMWTWADFTYNTTIKTFEALEANIGDVFFDAMVDELKTLEDYWTVFTRALYRAWADMLGKMVTEYIKAMAQMAMSESSFGLGGFLGGMMSGASGWLSGLFNSGAAAGSIWEAIDIASTVPIWFVHEGGTIGDHGIPTRRMPRGVMRGAPRLHEGLADDEFPAILQKGETVIPRNSAGGIYITVYGDLVDPDSWARKITPYIAKAQRDGVR